MSGSIQEPAREAANFPCAEVSVYAENLVHSPLNRKSIPAVINGLTATPDCMRGSLWKQVFFSGVI